jgi:hypothetical protein
VLVSGRELTWYGPSLATARESLQEQIRGNGRPEMASRSG